MFIESLRDAISRNYDPIHWNIYIYMHDMMLIKIIIIILTVYSIQRCVLIEMFICTYIHVYLILDIYTRIYAIVRPKTIYVISYIYQ